MPVFHDKKFLDKLLEENNISKTDAVKRGLFYQNHFEWDKYSDMYKQGASIRDICKETGLSYDVVRVNLMRNLIELREFKAPKSKYKFNRDLFFPNPTNIGSYFLGWLYSDGCITKNKINITLQKRDKEHLKYISSLVYDKDIFEVKNGFAFEYFDVELMKLFMNKYKLIQDKSHTDFLIPFDKFRNTMPYLLLGLLEGDGSISSKYLSCQLLLTESTWNVLTCYLTGIVDLSKINVKRLNEYGLFSIKLRGESYFSLLYYIYSNMEDVKPLERKRNLFIQQIQRSMNGKTSPYKKLACNIWDSLHT